MAQSIAMQLEKRAHYGAAMKKAIEKALSGKALGIKIMVSGRLGGAEIARTEWKREGRVPLHTLCADIDRLAPPALKAMPKEAPRLYSVNMGSKH